VTRTAFLTGAYGYLGSLVRARLDAAGWTTVAMVRRPRSEDQAVSWSLGEAPPRDLKQADALVHCAYDFGPRTRADIWRVNVEGSSVLLRAAASLRVPRVVTVSSMSAYAGTHQLYGQAKLAIEEVSLSLGGIAIRPGLVYGDSPAGMAGALVKATRLPLVPVIGGQAQQFPVHEDDLANTIVAVLDAPNWIPEVFGIAQATPVSFRTLMAALAEQEGRVCRFLPVPWPIVYWSLRVAEALGIPSSLRADSVWGLVRPAPFVPRSTAFPQMLGRLRVLAPSTGTGRPGEASG
jgi:nucleoside-diphosphate-sugar epimerase